MCYCSARLSVAFPPHDVNYTSFTVSHLICEQTRERVQPTDVNCLARWTRLRFHNFLCFLRRRSRMTLRFIFGGYMCAELSSRWETIVSRWSREEKLKMTKTLFQLVCLRRFYSFLRGIATMPTAETLTHFSPSRLPDKRLAFSILFAVREWDCSDKKTHSRQQT